MAVEVARHVPRLAEKRKLDPALLPAALQVMPIEWKPASVYEDHREQAESRIAARDPDEWPTLALASKLGFRESHRHVEMLRHNGSVRSPHARTPTATASGHSWATVLRSTVTSDPQPINVQASSPRRHIPPA